MQCLPFYIPAGAFALCIIIGTYLPSQENNHSLQRSMALHAGLVISIPLGIDILLDLFALRSLKWDMLHVFSRIMLFVSLSLPYYTANENELIYHSAELFRNVGACGAIFALTSGFRFVGLGGRFGSAYFQSLLMMATMLTFSCLRLALEFGSNNNYLDYTATVLQIAFLVQLLVYAALCCLSLRHKCKSAGVEKISIQELFTAAYLLAFTISGVVVIPCFLLPLPLETSFIIQEYIALGFYMTVLMIPSRVSKEHIAQLQHHLEQRSTFVRYISHEIRTPLNTVFLGVGFVKGEVEKMYADCGSAQLHSVLETVNDVNDSCQLALDTLNELLLFDKFECGKLKAELEPTNSWNFLSDVVKSFRQTVEKRQIELTLVCDGKESNWYQAYLVELDRTKFGQVMRNLVSNALKFTPAGGRVEIIISKVVRKSAKTKSAPTFLPTSLRIYGTTSQKQIAPEISTLSLLRTAEDDPDSFPVLRIEVRDSGAGISPKNLPLLFGQYVQFDANKLQNGGGSGLGLWITKGIVEMHGGCIGAISDGEGLGSCFYVELPLRPCTELSNWSAVEWKNSHDCQDSKAASARSFLSSTPFVWGGGVGLGAEVISSRRRTLSMGARRSFMLSSPTDELLELDSVLECGGETTRAHSATVRASNLFLHSNSIISSRDSLDKVEVYCAKTAALSFLVVDDSAANRKIVKRLLFSLGHSVNEASDGSVCMRMLTEECQKQLCADNMRNWRSSQYDVILMDDNMAQLSGPEATKLLRDQGFVGVIIGVTGNTLPQDVKRFQDAGANSVLSKPLKMEQLQHILTDLVNK